MFKRRMRVRKKRSRKMFSKHARRTHPMNVHRYPMRGGFRL